MKKILLFGLMSFVALVMMTSCNKAPQVEMDAANAALNEAKASGAEMYLPNEFAQANDALNAVMLTIEGKKSKWFASYKEETVKLEDARVMATQLKENTEVRKNEVKAEVENALVEIKTVLEENTLLLTQAPKGKEGAAALEAIKEEMAMLETNVNEVNGLLSAGSFLDAQSKVTAIREKALSINMELKAAIAKTSKRK